MKFQQKLNEESKEIGENFKPKFSCQRWMTLRWNVFWRRISQSDSKYLTAKWFPICTKLVSFQDTYFINFLAIALLLCAAHRDRIISKANWKMGFCPPSSVGPATFYLYRLHTVSFDWFLSGLEWILNLEFCLHFW